MMIAAVLAPKPSKPLLQHTFTGSIADPEMGGLYRYDDHVDAPCIGPKAARRRATSEVFDSTSAMATWISMTPHSRPFWRDPGFVVEFGRATRVELRAAVDELWRRADDAARAARMPIDWPASLPEHKEAGDEPNERN